MSNPTAVEEGDAAALWLIAGMRALLARQRDGFVDDTHSIAALMEQAATDLPVSQARALAKAARWMRGLVSDQT